MKFEDAMELAKAQGKKIRRPHWDKDLYVYWRKGALIYCCHDDFDGSLIEVKFTDFDGCREDILATDWKVIEC